MATTSPRPPATRSPTLAEEGLLRRIDWKKLPSVRQTIDPKFLGLPHDPDDRWSVPKDWGTTGFMYRTDKIKERPTSWAQFFSLFEKYPRKLTLLDGSAEVIGSVAVMMGYSFNTDADEGARAGADVPAPLAAVRPRVRLARLRHGDRPGQGVRRARLERRRRVRHRAHAQARGRLRRRDGRRRAVGRRARHPEGRAEPARRRTRGSTSCTSRGSARWRRSTRTSARPSGARCWRRSSRRPSCATPTSSRPRRRTGAWSRATSRPRALAARERIWAEVKAAR